MLAGMEELSKKDLKKKKKRMDTDNSLAIAGVGGGGRGYGGEINGDVKINKIKVGGRAVSLRHPKQLLP